jgi:hypothetical protein
MLLHKYWRGSAGHLLLACSLEEASKRRCGLDLLTEEVLLAYTWVSGGIREGERTALACLCLNGTLVDMVDNA